MEGLHKQQEDVAWSRVTRKSCRACPAAASSLVPQALLTRSTHASAHRWRLQPPRHPSPRPPLQVPAPVPAPTPAPAEAPACASRCTPRLRNGGEDRDGAGECGRCSKGASLAVRRKVDSRWRSSGAKTHLGCSGRRRQPPQWPSLSGNHPFLCPLATTPHHH